jgi:arylsulfatase A-like enzyme
LDIAPTVLNLFGIPAPDYMDGRVLEIAATMKPPDVSHESYQTQVA